MTEKIAKTAWHKSWRPNHVRPVIPPILYVLGMALIGMVVVPTHHAFQAGMTTSELVLGRVAWGCIAALALVMISGQSRALGVVSKRSLKRSVLQAATVAIGTTFAYAQALQTSSGAPVITVIVGAAVIVAILLDRLSVRALFVPAALVSAMGFVILSSYGAEGSLTTPGLAWSALAGAIYGFLPKLLGGEGGDPAIELVHYLAVAALGLLLVLLLGGTGPARIVQVLVSPSSMIAGILCTGVAYYLVARSLRPTGDISSGLSATQAALLLGVEPIAVICAEALWLGKPLTPLVIVAMVLFGFLASLATDTLAKITND